MDSSAQNTTNEARCPELTVDGVITMCLPYAPTELRTILSTGGILSTRKRTLFGIVGAALLALFLQIAVTPAGASALETREGQLTFGPPDPGTGPDKQKYEVLPEPHQVAAQSSCDDVKNNLARVRKSGQKTAVCFEFQRPQQQAGSKQLAPSVASSGVWCDAAPMDKAVVTRFAICSVRNMLILLIDTKTGATLGKATGIIEQEIGTAISSVEFSEHLTFKLVKSEITTSAMTVKIDSTCSVDGSCRQDTQPWSFPRPITVGGSIDGTWTRSWTGNVGRKEFLIDYAITVSMAGTSGTARWGGNGQPGGGQYKVRCDNEFATYAGCVVPEAIMTLDVQPKYSGARKYIAAVQESLNTHPGWQGHGEPLHREAITVAAGMNRAVICDGTFTASSNTPPPAQCDEWPFAGSKESGRSYGVKSGAECQQYFVYATTDSSGAPTLGLMWPGFLQGVMPSPTAKCARASMTKVDNEGVGGDLGRFTQKWRLIDNDPYWVNSGAGLPW